MKRLLLLSLVAIMAFGTMSCRQNYSNGERIGFVTKFSEKGVFWKSWEGELNLTQTGMNTSSLFDFSIDNDTKGQDGYSDLIKTLDSAAIYGWKIKAKYHETFGWNWFSNRGETNYFVTKVEVLDKAMVNNIKDITNPSNKSNAQGTGRAVDTIYVIVIDPKDVKKYIK